MNWDHDRKEEHGDVVGDVGAVGQLRHFGGELLLGALQAAAQLVVLALQPGDSRPTRTALDDGGGVAATEEEDSGMVLDVGDGDMERREVTAGAPPLETAFWSAFGGQKSRGS